MRSGASETASRQVSKSASQRLSLSYTAAIDLMPVILGDERSEESKDLRTPLTNLGPDTPVWSGCCNLHPVH
jgi:hypothetical protein